MLNYNIVSFTAWPVTKKVVWIIYSAVRIHSVFQDITNRTLRLNSFSCLSLSFYLYLFLLILYLIMLFFPIILPSSFGMEICTLCSPCHYILEISWKYGIWFLLHRGSQLRNIFVFQLYVVWEVREVLCDSPCLFQCCLCKVSGRISTQRGTPTSFC